MRNLLRSAILVASALCAMPALAETVTVVSTSLPTTQQVVHLNAPYNENVYSQPQLYKLSDGSSVLLDCIDLAHNLLAPPLTFTKTTLAAYFPAMSQSQLQHLAGLIVLGTTGPINDAMNAAQSAVWNFLQPGVESSDNVAFQAQVTAINAAGYTADPNKIVVFQSNDGSQTMAGAVPEPATWALLLVGFGGVGFIVRVRRTRDAHVTA